MAKKNEIQKNELPIKTFNALQRAGIKTWKEVAKWADEELLELHGIGPVGLKAINEYFVSGVEEVVDVEESVEEDAFPPKPESVIDAVAKALVSNPGKVMSCGDYTAISSASEVILLSKDPKGIKCLLDAVNPVDTERSGIAIGAISKAVLGLAEKISQKNEWEAAEKAKEEGAEAKKEPALSEITNEELLKLIEERFSGKVLEIIRC